MESATVELTERDEACTATPSTALVDRRRRTRSAHRPGGGSVVTWHFSSVVLVPDHQDWPQDSQGRRRRNRAASPSRAATTANSRASTASTGRPVTRSSARSSQKATARSRGGSATCAATWCPASTSGSTATSTPATHDRPSACPSAPSACRIRSARCRRGWFRPRLRAPPLQRAPGRSSCTASTATARTTCGSHPRCAGPASLRC